MENKILIGCLYGIDGCREGFKDYECIESDEFNKRHKHYDNPHKYNNNPDELVAYNIIMEAIKKDCSVISIARIENIFYYLTEISPRFNIKLI